MSSIKANQLKKDMYVSFKNQPHQVLKCEFYFPGKGSAFARTKLRNLKTQHVLEYTYKSSDSVQLEDVETVELQYLYRDDDTHYLMDPRTFEQYEVDEKIFEGKGKWLQPEMKIFVTFYDEEVVGCRFPLKVNVEVIEAEESVAGNTVNGAKKPVKVVGDIEVMVPLFIKKGTKIIVSTADGSYVSRVT